MYRTRTRIHANRILSLKHAMYCAEVSLSPGRCVQLWYAELACRATTPCLPVPGKTTCFLVSSADVSALETSIGPIKDEYAHLNESQRRTLQHLESLSRFTDSAFRVPGTNFRFGWDGIIGWIPWVGKFYM
eukprot:jgi/Chrzof1/10476/Cz05g00010.t1